MRKFLRFLLSAADQALVTASTVQANDHVYSATPSAGAPYPQSLQISFTASATPHLIPLFPGELRFIPSLAAPGVTPQPEGISAAAYPTWKVRGTLMVKVINKDVMKQFVTLMAPVGPIPTTLWYGPVVITQDFLFTTLATGLVKKDVVAGDTKIKPTNALWQRHAIARFLQGLYHPELRLGATAADDDVVRFPMPEIFGSGGSFDLNIAVARTQKPQDAKDEDFDTNSGGTPRTDPTNHAHGAIPARHVYRTMRSEMLDAAVGSAVPDAVLKDWPHAQRYFPFRFTRTWNREHNASVHLPKCAVKVALATGGMVLADQRLPAHGWFFLSQLPAATPPDPPRVSVTLSGDVRWLDGARPNVWRWKGETAPIVFPLSSTDPHIVVRRRMRDEIFADRSRPAPGGMRCTYMSLRRMVRALVDNRITGGRLVFEKTGTSTTTKKLMDDALLGTPATSATLINGLPKPSANPTTTSPTLGKFWEAFFPDTAPAHSVNGSTARTEIFTLGQVGYFLWQVSKKAAEPDTWSNFSSDHLGRGSAAALVATGLSTGFTVDATRLPPRLAGDTDNQYYDRIVLSMMANVEPGSLLQFWKLNSDYEKLKARNWGIVEWGHSPTFVRPSAIDPATGLPGGIVVIDQFGESELTIVKVNGTRRIEWHEVPIEIWCAAGWDE